ncbi:MAG: tRNA lysidine(34) synthetase TilS [Pseudomonadota bacterium]
MITLPENIGDIRKIGLAVSGGIDSVCMLHMVSYFKAKYEIVILTVDHGLRPEAALEAEMVADIARAYNFPCHILKVTDNPPKTGLQNFARIARYKILSQAADKYKLDMICLGHHQDDLCETLLMRLQHQSGLRGLAVMPSYFHHLGALFHRPMLHLSRDMIKAYADKYNLSYCDDPSNDNRKYERTSVRQFLQENDLSETLLKLYHKAKLYRALSTHHRDCFISKHVFLSYYGYVELPKDIFSQQSADLQKEILRYLISFVTGKSCIELKKSPDKSTTFGGAYIHFTSQKIKIFREKRNLPLNMQLKKGYALFDKRFYLKIPDDGILYISEEQNADCPYFARRVLPMLETYHGETFTFIDILQSYQPSALNKFNPDPILHHLAIKPPTKSSLKSEHPAQYCNV